MASQKVKLPGINNPVLRFLLIWAPPVALGTLILFLLTGSIIFRIGGFLLGSGLWGFFIYILSISPERDFLFLGKVYTKGNSSKKQVALTFDDGPSPANTLPLLDLLKKKGKRATFFCVGKNVEKYPEIVKQAVQENHEMGNHTYNHEVVNWKSGRFLYDEIVKTQKLLENITGTSPIVFRPPRGHKDYTVLKTAENLGMKTVQWSLDPKDWELPGSDAIFNAMKDQLFPGAIILLHDGSDQPEENNRAQTIEAVEKLITYLDEEGYEIVTAGELLK